MVSAKGFRELAMSFPEVTAAPHFERTAFKVKKIFASLDEKAGLACLMLAPVDQSAFCAIDSSIIYPVPNKWGLQGATYVVLSKVQKSLLLDALTCAYIAKAPKALAAPFIEARERMAGL
jgi:hypothetical protein